MKLIEMDWIGLDTMGQFCALPTTKCDQMHTSTGGFRLIILLVLGSDGPMAWCSMFNVQSQ